MTSEKSAQPTEPGAVLISIRTRFVRSILEGTKTFELRRKIPRYASGMPLLVYSSGEDKAITVHAKVATVAAGTPETIWAQHSGHLGVTQAEFSAYFNGADIAYALQLEDVIARPRPVTLKELRTEHLLEPPQSWRYIPKDSYARLVEPISGRA